MKITYSCDEVRANFDSWKAEFREKNRSDMMLVDEAYNGYVAQLQGFLDQCKCEPICLVKG